MKPSSASKAAAASSPSPGAKRKRSPKKAVDPTTSDAADAAAANSSAAAATSSSPSNTSAAAAKKKTKKQKTTTTTNAAEKKKQQQHQRNVVVSSAATATPSPTHVLVVDNGGETIKYGWSNSKNDGSLSETTRQHDYQPNVLENVTARLPQQWTVLVADQLDSMVSNRNQLIHVTRSMERGMICNMGNQVQVWKRMLDLLGVAIPSLSTTTAASSFAAKAFGWKPLTVVAASAAAGKKKKAAPKSQESRQPVVTTIIPASTCAILLTVPPHCPRTLLDQILLVWMEDFGFSHVGLVTGPLVLAHSLLLTSSSDNTAAADAADLQTSCVVDMGWSATHIVPTYRGRPILAAATAPASSSQTEEQQRLPEWTIRRFPLGGRHLINLWKYYCTYRQYNLMDQDWILRDVLIQTAYLALDFERGEMHQARLLPAGHRPYDVEYVLPDFTTTFEGRVRQSPALLYAQRKREEQQNAKQQKQDGDEDEDDDGDEEDEDFVAEENMEEDDGDDDDDEVNIDMNSEKQSATDVKDVQVEEDDDDEEEEDIDALRKRLLKQRQDEVRRRLQEEQDQQVLSVSTERFAIPEVLFRPSDAGLPADWPGLASAIVEAIQACPEYYRAALYQSIHVVGGLSQLTNLQERLQRELRTLVPCEYEISITMASSSSPTNQTWLGAVKMAQREPYTSWSVSRDEWEAKRGAWSRLLVAQGGSLV